MNVIYISGSPCSGKSTISKKIANKYGYKHIKFDDFLNLFIKIKAEEDVICNKVKKYTPDEMWLRNPELMCEEELYIYKTIMPLLKQKIRECSFDNGIIVDGAGILPTYMKEEGVSKNRYVCIIPTKEFQIEKYSKRWWVRLYLKKCSDPKVAFSNWMERDYLFRERILEDTKKCGYPYLIVDGSQNTKEILKKVEGIFMLG